MSEVKWKVIYPCYLNSKTNRDKGRRVQKANCVIDPTANEIILALTN